MSDAGDDLTRACQVLADYVRAQEHEKHDIFFLEIPAQIVLTWLPLINLAVAHIEERRENNNLPEGFDGPQLDQVLQQQRDTMSHVLSRITHEATDGDSFKIFDLHARMQEAGVPIGIFFEDEDGVEYIAPKEGE